MNAPKMNLNYPKAGPSQSKGDNILFDLDGPVDLNQTGAGMLSHDLFDYISDIPIPMSARLCAHWLKRRSDRPLPS
jgi:hypothetical protein